MLRVDTFPRESTSILSLSNNVPNGFAARARFAYLSEQIESKKKLFKGEIVSHRAFKNLIYISLAGEM